jgi:hypothetical protein
MTVPTSPLTLYLCHVRSDDDDRRDSRRGGGYSMGGPSLYFGPSPFDFFYYRPYGYYETPT